jgi:UDP-GlcNAc:undecaprenyl-phosphate GlcNAc-1-phosphate transferase
MLGSTLGFLVYNFNPASIFMGDTGSMFLGFMIAVIALLGYKSTTVTSLIVPIIILFLPILDTIFAIFRRIIKGEKPTTPDKSHIHHQLLKLNKSTKKTVLIMYGFDILCAAISIFYVLGDNKLAIVLYIVLLAVTVFLIFKTDILFEHKTK